MTKATHTTIEPVWNETFEFDLEGLDECSHVTIVMKEVCACTSAWPHMQPTATHTHLTSVGAVYRLFGMG